MTHDQIDILPSNNPKNYPKYTNEFWAFSKSANRTCKLGNYVTPKYLNQIRNNFKLRDNDIFLATYPRVGTTMTRRVVLALLEKKMAEIKNLDGSLAIERILENNVKDMGRNSPFIEFEEYYEDGDRDEWKTLVHT